MTSPLALEGLLERALLVYDARAMHAGADAGDHAAVFVNDVARGLLPIMEACDGTDVGELLGEAYRCLSFAAANPLRQGCREREELVRIACHALAYALLAGPQGRASEDEVHDLIAEKWTASLLAWSMIFPPSLDAVSPPCACGALGTRPALPSARS